MKVLIIPDVHGSHEWEVAKTKIAEVDYVVFLGDFFDSWTNKWPDQGENFLNICNFKRDNPDKVKLLIGNHDWSYISGTTNGHNCSGHQYEHASEIKSALLSNLDIIDLAFECDGWVFSHAGFSATAIRKMKAVLKRIYSKYPSLDGKEFSSIEEKIKYVEDNTVEWDSREYSIDFLNKAWHERSHIHGDSAFSNDFDEILDWNGVFSGSGDEKTQFCLWIRPHSLLEDAFYDKQIVGHTEYCFWVDPIVLQKDNKKVMLTDSLDHHIHIIDTNEEFKGISELDLKKKIKKLNKALCDLKAFFGIADRSGTPMDKKAVVLKKFPQNGEFLWNNFFKKEAIMKN